MRFLHVKWMEEDSTSRSCAGKMKIAGGKRGSRRRRRTRRLGHRRSRAESRGRKEIGRAKTSGRGLYALAAGSPDASGDHQTKTQRVFYFGRPPDDGHRTLALASGALGHAWISTGRTSLDAVGTLFLRPVSAVQQTHRTRRSAGGSGASSSAPLATFST